MEDFLVKIPKERVPEGIQVGQELQASTEQGEVSNVVVTEVNEDHVVIDGNHPLAGKDLIFEIEVVSLG